MLGRYKISGNRGDTIVEVLVVLAVLGLALSIAFATANRSLQAARQAQESSQGSVLLQSQVEKLRYLASVARPPLPPIDKEVFQAGPYCITEATPGVYKVEDSPPPDICTFDGRGRQPCPSEPCYKVDIKWGGSPTDKFLLTANWQDVSGQGAASVTTVFRTHKVVGP